MSPAESGRDARGLTRMTILIVVGARPNFMKAAPILEAINAHNARMSADSADRHERPAIRL